MIKNAKRSLVISLAVIVTYLIVLIHPNMLFANEYEYRNFRIYADQEITGGINFVLDDAISRIAHSELYEDDDEFRVYICNDAWRFKLFTRNGNAGGLVNFMISPNIFIRESDIENNELIPPHGWMYTPKERPLSYFIAHEAIHSLERKYSPLLQVTTPSYILEGYADYIAKRPDFDYERYKEMYLTNDRLMDPENGLYHKYHLYVAFLIDKKGYSFSQLVNEKPDLNDTLELIASY